MIKKLTNYYILKQKKFFFRAAMIKVLNYGNQIILLEWKIGNA